MRRPTPLQVIAMLAVTASLVGGASLARFFPTDSALGPVGELRFVLLGAAATLLMILVARGLALRRLRRDAGLWVLGVLAAHAWVALSVLWAAPSRFAHMQLYEIALLLVLLATILWSVREDPTRGLRLMLGTTYALSVSITLVSLAVSGELPGEDTIPGVGGIGMARILGSGALAAGFFALRERRLLWLLPVPFFLLGVLQSGSRAAALALVVAALVWWFLSARRRAVLPAARLRMRRILIGAAVAAALVAATPLGRGAFVAFGRSLLTSEPSDTAATGGDIYIADRDVIFLHAIEASAASLPGGLGLGSYLGPFGELYPHNLLLSFLVDAGVIAFAAAALLCVYAFVRLARRRDDAVEAALASAVFFFVASMFAGTYYDARHLWIYLLLGILIQDEAVRSQPARPARYGRLLIRPAGANSYTLRG